MANMIYNGEVIELTAGMEKGLDKLPPITAQAISQASEPIESSKVNEDENN